MEKTNREGFVESAAYWHSSTPFSLPLNRLKLNATSIRNESTRSMPGQRPRNLSLRISHSFGREIEKHEMIKPLMHYVDRIETQYRDVLDRLLVAAGSGLNLAAVMHEVEKGIGALYAAISRGDKRERLVELAKRLSDMVDGLNWLTRQSGKATVQASALIRQAILNSEFRFRGHEIHICDGMEEERILTLGQMQPATAYGRLI